jgi:hypothetical protein
LGGQNITAGDWLFGKINISDVQNFLFNYNQTSPAISYADATFYNKSANINATGYNVTAGFFFGDGSQLTGLSGGNASFNQSLTDSLYAGIEWDYNQTTPAIDYADETFITLANEGNLNVNSSDFWDDLDSPPATWLSTYNSTYDGLIKWGYNMTTPAETYANANFYNKSANIDTGVYNITATEFIGNHNWTFNQNYPSACADYAVGVGDVLTCGDWDTTIVNSSTYWADMSSVNATQIENNGGVLNILESWLKSLFYTESEVDNLVGTADLHTHDGANITTGTIAFARLPTLTNTHTLDWANITNKVLNNALTLSGENITAGTVAFSRLPTLTDTHTHNAANVTAGTFGIGNYIFPSNITATDSIKYLNSSGTATWRTYVNGSGALITEYIG